LFDFFYRIEIYVPEPKRTYGYYVYPFLLGERFVARVDLKADRATATLRVNSAWLEADQDQGHVAVELATELRSMAGWLGLSDIEVSARGDLAPALSTALSTALSPALSTARAPGKAPALASPRAPASAHPQRLAQTGLR
jgi:uncharacterized protein YcaQ